MPAMTSKTVSCIRLYIPAGKAVIPATADSYEIDFPLADATLLRDGENLVFGFKTGGELILSSFYGQYAARAQKAKFIMDGAYFGSLAFAPANAAAQNFNGANVQPRRHAHTIGQFFEQEYLPHRKRLQRSAMDSYLLRGRWKNHISDYFGAKELNALRPRDFEDFVHWLRCKNSFGETTILHCLVDLRRVWNYASQTGAVSGLFPGRQMIQEIAKSLDNEKKCFLAPEEAALLVQTVYDRRLNSRLDHDIYCYVLLGLGLGLRAGEIHRLTLQAVERHIIERTKNRRSRFVHFDFAPVAAMLEERLRLYPPANEREPLFKAFAKNAKSITRQSVPKKYYDLIKELGFNEIPRRKDHHLEKIDFHALRHTFAALGAMRGVDHLTLMRLMGHKTPAMTLRYIEIADSHQAAYQEKAMAGIFPPELQKQK